MPIVSGGGGGTTSAQVAVSGKVLPVANASGVTVDTTTYNDPIAGGGAKLTTLVFPADVGALAFALSGDAFPRWLFASNPNDGLYFGDGTADSYIGNAQIRGGLGSTTLGLPVVNVSGQLVMGTPAAGSTQAARLDQVSPKFSTTSGALSTATLPSGTGTRIVTDRDIETLTPVTFNPGAATTATCTVELSPDNSTYTTLGVVTVPAGVALDGTVQLIKVRVPAAWYVKLTVNAQAVIGTTTYY